MDIKRGGYVRSPSILKTLLILVYLPLRTHGVYRRTAPASNPSSAALFPLASRNAATGLKIILRTLSTSSSPLASGSRLHAALPTSLGALPLQASMEGRGNEFCLLPLHETSLVGCHNKIRKSIPTLFQQPSVVPNHELHHHVPILVRPLQ